ncbi:LPD7 domain-containing protein [Pseudomonas protegens]|uniref:LPD7 domain-containing protein n=1 Tax=Pseudomonas protegens TaxID=380021 RepID=UPI00280C351E|nr:LPD7 domain-containing protein [Pseudomonas protegens]
MIQLPRSLIQGARAPTTRKASTVAGYFLRQHQDNRILPAHKRALWRIDRQFYETRRALYSDDRFTRQEKQQLVAVLVFERMKARQGIEQGDLPQEGSTMGSKEIRDLLSPEEDMPDNSISRGNPASARERLQRMMDNLKQGLDSEAQRERIRELSARDLYTKRARFSQNVHYLDKRTDKTVFVDSGKAITLRREGLSESGVAVALALAKERFGSSLTVKGSAEFKRLVVEAVVKNGLDVHFTDKAMNQRLAERRAEFEAEREGLQITSPTGPDEPEHADEAQAVAQQESPDLLQGILLDHGPAHYKFDAKQDMSYFVRLETGAGEKVYWGVGLKEAMAAQPFNLGLRIRLEDQGTQPVMVRMRDEAGQEIEKIAHRRVWSAEAVDPLPEPVGESAPRRGGAAEAAGVDEPESGQSLQVVAQKVKSDSSNQLRGILLDHGPAHYKHDAQQDMSYFVRLKTDFGEKVLWGIGLEEALQSADFKLGQRILLEDQGTQPVTVMVRNAQGIEEPKATYRRVWVAEPEGVERTSDAKVLLGSAEALQARSQVDVAEGSAILAREQAWLKNSGLSMDEVGNTPAIMGMRAEDHAVQILYGADASAEGRALAESLMVNEAYRATFAHVVSERTERLNRGLREELLASPGYAVAQEMLATAERTHGPVSEAVMTVQAGHVAEQARLVDESGQFNIAGVIEAIEREDQAFLARVSPVSEAQPVEPKEAPREQSRVEIEEEGPEMD